MRHWIPSPWSASAWLLALPIALPILVLIHALFGPPSANWQHLQQTVLATYITNTLLLMLGVGFLSLLMGVGCAWLTARYTFFGSRLLAPALVLPLAAPAYLTGYVYADLLEYSGPVQSLLKTWSDDLGWQMGLPSVRSLPGAAMVLALVLYPYIFVLARTSFLQQGSALLDAARTLGATSLTTFWRVGLPIARPAIAGGLALVLMETVADFGVVEHFGVPTLTAGIFRTWFAMGAYQTALQLAAWLFGIVLLLVLAEQLSRRGVSFAATSTRATVGPIPLQGVHSMLACLACALPVALGFLIPLGYLVYLVATFVDLTDLGALITPLLNSVQVAGVAAACCGAAALWLSYAQRLGGGVGLQLGIRVATLGYAIPGMVLAVAILPPLASVDKALAGWLGERFGFAIGLLFTGTVSALVFVYVARFLTVAYNSTQGGFSLVHPNLDAAARSLGSSPADVLRRVHLPLLRPALVAALLLVFIDVMKELPATLILRPFNFETLATQVFRLAGDERLAEAALPALMIMSLSILPVVTYLLAIEPKLPKKKL